MEIRFAGQVAIVTGAGRGLGRSHALGLAARGARVVVVDFDRAAEGDTPAASEVSAEIRARGGEAIALGADVVEPGAVQDMVDHVLARWGRVDILINNAGILRDKTFAKMDLADFRLILEVHVMGTVNCTKVVWEAMRERKYGRIVLTASGSGLYGNFGQSNYGTAKAAMVGLMNVLHLEGEKHNIRTNILLPTAATSMTDGLLPDAVAALATPEIDHARRVVPRVGECTVPGDALCRGGVLRADPDHGNGGGAFSGGGAHAREYRRRLRQDLRSGRRGRSHHGLPADRQARCLGPAGIAREVRAMGHAFTNRR